jgi:hypothetical protein
MKTATAAPNPFHRRPANFNLLKFRALEAFEINGPMNPPVWAVHVGFYPARSAYTYLLRLYRFGLLQRRLDDGGLIVYSISRRGRERLEWLRTNYRQRKEAGH